MNKAPKNIAELNKMLKYVSMKGAFPVWKAEFQGGSIWTPADNTKGKIYYFYNAKSNTTGQMTPQQVEQGLKGFTEFLTTDTFTVTKKNNTPGNKSNSPGKNNWASIALIGIGVLTLALLFND